MGLVNNQWTEVLSMLKNRLSKPSFDTWLRHTKARIEENRWVIIAPNEFARDWLEARYQTVISETIHELTQRSPELIFIMEQHVPVDDLEIHQSSLSMRYSIEELDRISILENEIKQLKEQIKQIELRLS